jgi:hypothetical protein
MLIGTMSTYPILSYYMGATELLGSDEEGDTAVGLEG